MNFGGLKRVFLVGIAGAGMSSLAEVLQGAGLEVIGSDLVLNDMTHYLETLGIEVMEGHGEQGVVGCDALIYSSAIPPENPALRMAHQQNIPVVKRAEMLGEIMKQQQTLAISGTHGKTTTTLMLGSIWSEGRWNATVMGGGVYCHRQTGTRMGSSEYLIAEADEYDRSFLSMYPSVILINNIDADHLECYGTLENLKDAFIAFTERLPFYGKVVVNIDDKGVASILPRIKKKVITYGQHSNADYRWEREARSAGNGFRICWGQEQESVAEISLQVGGSHNASNGAGAFALSHTLGVPVKQIEKGLADFKGVKRRLEFLEEKNGISFYDDYAHHPEEVRVTLNALNEKVCETRGLKKRHRLVTIFQPHLYSRTQQFYKEFALALSGCDRLFVTSVYGSREVPLEGVEGNLICDEISREGLEVTYLKNSETMVEDVVKQLHSGDIVVTMGAGDINLRAREIIESVGELCV